MKTVRAAVAAILGMVLGGVGFVATAPVASAHVPEVSATCTTLTVDLTKYQPPVAAHEETFRTVHHEALGEPTIPNPGYVKGVPAVTHTEWKYEEHGGSGEIWLNRNTYKYIQAGVREGTDTKPDEGVFYERTSKTRVVTDTAEILAVGEPTMPNPDYVKAWDEQVSNNDAVAPKVNHVTVLVNEVQVASEDFGTSWNRDFPVQGGDTYKVIVRAWDDPDGTKGWSKNFRGVIEKCLVPVFPPQIMPTCDTPGSLPVLPTDQPAFTFTWSKDGLIMIAKRAHKSDALGDTSVKKVWTKTYTEPGAALGFQNNDSEGVCYVKPMTKDATTVVTTTKWACDAKTAVTSSVTTTYAFAFDPKTGTYGEAVATAGAPVAGTRDLTASEFVACPIPDTIITGPTLASTGADVSPWGIGAGLLALVSGLGLLVARKRV